MKVYAFVGPSGTGKSHNAQSVAYKNNIRYIIDDALLIKGNKVIAGRSAKTEPTKIGSVKAALFTDESRRDIMRKAIKAEKVDSILILGTSDNMVREIQENLGLPEIEKTIYINQVSTEEQIEEAKRIRKEEGKHVVPVPTFEIKEQFSGYLLDQLKIFEKKDAVYSEKSVIRPTFSYLGNFNISDKVIKEIISFESKKADGITKITKIDLEKYVDGIKIILDVYVRYGSSIPVSTTKLQTIIAGEIDYMTGINILAIDVFVKGIDLKER